MTKNTILIVDDSLAGRNILKAILGHEGYRIEFAHTGEEAIKKSFELKPDMVLLDVMLPDTNGFEVCKLIRNNPYTSLMPVIMVTALDDRDSKLVGIQSGADEFLSKPLDPLEVKARVRNVLKLDRFRRLLYDKATGLPNEMLFNDYIDNIILREAHNKVNFAILAVKLSNSMFLNSYLSKINDQKMLKGILDNFQNDREDVKIISYNSEGYFTIMINEAGMDKATGFASEIISAFSKPIEYLEGEMLICCKIGISLYPENGSGGSEITNNARLAYEESCTEKFNPKFYNKQIEKSYKTNVETAADIYNAIDKKEFVLHFQPQIRVSDREIIGVEALIRWDSKKYGFVFPDSFISQAEENGTIIKLGSWVIQDSLRYLSTQKISISINLSALQFDDPGLVARICDLSKMYCVAPERVILEITESAIMANKQESRKKMEALKEKGFKLSIDDFGTGQASLAYLKNYPIDEIKIDREFIRGITTKKVDRGIVKHIIELAHTLDTTTVAEGVEEEAQASLLESMGCDIIQGYYFSRPVGENEMSELLIGQPFRKKEFRGHWEY